MEKLNGIQDFTLLKVKLNNEGGLNVTYEIKTTLDCVPSTNKHHVECGDIVHSDLIRCFNDLRPLMAKVFFFPQDCEDNLRVNGICLAGKEENKGCILTADYFTISEQPVPIRTPRIKFLESYYGFENELQDLANNIENEVYQYLFEFKNASSDMMEISVEKQ